MKLLVMLLVVLAGGVVSVQVSLNARLAQGLGSPFAAALVSSAVGALSLMPLVLSGRMGRTSADVVADLPVWAWLGGLCGAIYLTILALGLPRLGAAAALALVVAGQMVSAAAIDHFGLLAVPRQPFGLLRLAALAFVIIGAALLAASELLGSETAVS